MKTLHLNSDYPNMGPIHSPLLSQVQSNQQLLHRIHRVATLYRVMLYLVKQLVNMQDVQERIQLRPNTKILIQTPLDLHRQHDPADLCLNASSAVK